MLGDERSSMQNRTAILGSLVILATVVAGFVLMSLGDQIYRQLDRRVLIAVEAPACGQLV
jgi:hypothetical protein